MTPTPQWWKRPIGARATRAWILGPDGKSTPLIEAIVSDIDAIDIRLCELGREFHDSLPKGIEEKLKGLRQRIAVLQGEARPDEEVYDVEDIETLADVEKRAILRALEITKCNIPVAAAALGVGPATLYRRAKVFKLDLRSMRRKFHALASEPAVPTTVPKDPTA